MKLSPYSSILAALVKLRDVLEFGYWPVKHVNLFLSASLSLEISEAVVAFWECIQLKYPAMTRISRSPLLLSSIST